MTLLADVVTASNRVAGTSSRSGKVAILAELLGRLDADEVAIVTGFLSGLRARAASASATRRSTAWSVPPPPSRR